MLYILLHDKWVVCVCMCVCVLNTIIMALCARGVFPADHGGNDVWYPSVVVVEVPGLPRAASVEWQFSACSVSNAGLHSETSGFAVSGPSTVQGCDDSTSGSGGMQAGCYDPASGCVMCLPCIRPALELPFPPVCGGRRRTCVLYC